MATKAARNRKFEILRWLVRRTLRVSRGGQRRWLNALLALRFLRLAYEQTSLD